ncbi:MAG: energy transducer TonB [Gemmatimonadetes bacterium]|nr:energy transducer TonB [Gemmatimonadota bacterium]
MSLRSGLPVALALAAALAACGNDTPVQQPVAVYGASPFEYPVGLWDEGVEGETVLLIRITDVGAVDSAIVDRSSGYAEFDSAAVAGAHKLRFLPARRGDRRIQTWAKLPVRFTKDGGAAAGAAAAPGAS